MITVLVVDDEEPAVRELAYLLGKDERVGLVHTARSAEDAFRILREADVHLVFMDIHMPGLSGLETAAILARFAAPPALVFVTADESQAIAAYELAAVDYLLKPVRPARLAEAVRRIAEPDAAGAARAGLTGSGGGAGTRVAAEAGPAQPHGAVPGTHPETHDAAGPGGPPSPAGSRGAAGGQAPGVGHPASAGSGTAAGTPGPAEPADGAAAMVVVVQGDTSLRIPLAEITHVTAAGDYARLHTARGSFLERTPLSALESRWAHAGFLRIHRSALVRVASIEAVMRQDGVPVVKVAGTTLPVARRALSRVKASFGLNALSSERP